MVELLLALPVVLMLGLGVAQFTLVYQAKHALDYALAQAARQGAVDHASRESIIKGFAAGLVPYLYGAENLEQLVLAERRAAEHVEEGAAAGWIRLRQRSPTSESFEDWAEPALDPMGELIPGVIEIANDNLDSRRVRMQPASGSAGMVLSEPIGQRSGQTLADANLLRLEIDYGVRLIVPVVGALIIRAVSLWNGCSRTARPEAGVPPPAGAPGAPGAHGSPSRTGQRLGLLLLGAPGPLDRTQPRLCEFLTSGEDGGGASGRAGARIPLRTSATVRMMSTARLSQLIQARVDAASGLASPAAGGFGADGADGWGVIPAGPAPGDGGRRGSPSGPPALPPTWSAPSSNGFLRMGGDRPYGMPGLHPALCPVERARKKRHGKRHGYGGGERALAAGTRGRCR